MLHIGIIGLGAIGQRLIKQFTQHAEVEISAICDINEALVRETVNTIEGVAPYTDYHKLIADPKVELVYVAVPPKFHHQVVLEVIKANKHVLCEKPLANSLEEAKEMAEAAKEASIVHAMNFPLNYDRGATKFAQLINQNYVGKLRRLQLTMHFPQWPRVWQKNEWVGGREQGGFVLEVGVHFIQQTLKIFGDLKNIQSQLEFPEEPEKCETGIIATAELADGTPVLIEGLSQIAGKEYIGFTAYGTDGVLSLDNWGELRGGKDNDEVKEISLLETNPKSLINEIVKAVNGKEAELYDFQVGYSAQEGLEALRRK